jgi:hypothetical protein
LLSVWFFIVLFTYFYSFSIWRGVHVFYMQTQPGI